MLQHMLSGTLGLHGTSLLGAPLGKKQTLSAAWTRVARHKAVRPAGNVKNIIIRN